MSKSIFMSAMTMLVLACGPDLDEQDDVPGELVYEQLYNRVYRFDHRIDASFEYPGEADKDWKCGLLTDRAHDELESTLATLDPRVDYGNHPADCDPHGALVHIDDFEHSPFECGFGCCHRDLSWAAVIYTMALNNFEGIYPTLDGEPYVAIEPDLACP